VYPWDPGFTITGATMLESSLTAGSVWTITSYGADTGPQQTPSPFTVSCMLDTVGGAFDIVIKDLTSTRIRIAVDGEYLAQAGHGTPGNTALATIAAVSGLPAGRHRVDVEFCGGGGTSFCGFNIGPLDQVHPTAKPDLKVVVIGDSMGVSVHDTAASFMPWAWPQILGQMLGVECVASCAGGTGYIAVGANGRVKIGDRVVDDVPDDADVLIWAGGLNDYNLYSTQVQAAAEAAIASMVDAIPDALQIVTGPIWPQGNLSINAEVMTVRDQLTAAADTYGFPFIDWIESSPQQLTTEVPGTLASASLANASTLSSTVRYSAGTLLRIGDVPASTEYRAVLAVSGSGPYTLTLDGTALLAHAQGVALTPSGNGWVTGSGQQGSTSGLGTGDRYIGDDGTHPTSDLVTSGGHAALARYIYGELTRTDFS
jgi:hypothetical protein